MKRLLMLSLILGMVGCATRPVAMSDAKSVPPERVFAYSGQLDGSSGKIIVVRDIGHMGGGCPMAVFVDGTLAAHVRVGEVVTLVVPPGNHIAGVGPAGAGLCAVVNEEARRREVAVVVMQDAAIKLRLAMSQDGSYSIAPTAF